LIPTCVPTRNSAKIQKYPYGSIAMIEKNGKEYKKRAMAK